MNKEILRLSIPNIISNVTIPILGMVDLALMGHLGSEVFIGAIALGGVIFNFIYWGFSFLRMSTSGFTAQAFGKEDPHESFYILVRAILISLLISAVILLLKQPIEWLSFNAIGGSNEVENLAKDYFKVRIWAAPATLSLYAITGWLLGMQNAKYPMIIAIVVNLVNIFLSVLFVFQFNMNVKGVALGTALAQYIGVIIAAILFYRKYAYLVVALKKQAILNMKSLKEYFVVNSDIFIRTFCIIGVFTFFTSKSASTSDSILAINSLLIQFLLFFSFFIDGFAFAGEALAGKYFGAKQANKLNELTKKLFLWGLLLVFLFTTTYGLGTKHILRILTTNSNLIEQARPFFIWVIILPIISFASFVWDGIYIGVTASKAMRNSLLISSIFVFIPVYFLLVGKLETHALWLAMLSFMASRGIVQTVLYKSSILGKI